MARNKQKLINYHSSTATAVPAAVDIELGEIAIQHATKSGATIFTKTTDGSIAKFVTEDVIDAKISAATQSVDSSASITQIKADINTINDKLGTGITTANTVTAAVADAKKAGTDAMAEAQKRISKVQKGTDSDYLTVTTDGTEVTVTFDKGDLATTGNVNSVSTRVATIEEAMGATGTIGKAVAAVNRLDGSSAITGSVINLVNAAQVAVQGNLDSLSANTHTEITNLKNAIGTTSDASTVDSVYGAIAKAKAALEEKDTQLAAADTALGSRISALENLSATTSSAIQNVEGDSATYSEVTGTGTTKTVKNKIQAVSSSSASAKGLAEASDVKSYVDSVSGNVATTVSDISTRLSSAEGKLTTIQGSSATTGSIAKALADAKAYADDVKKDILTGGAEAQINSAYDTIKEIADWIGESGETATGANKVIQDVANLQEAVGTSGASSTGIYKIIEEKISAEKTQRENADNTISGAVNTIASDYLKASDKTELKNAITAATSTANSAVQTVTGDTYVTATKNGTTVTLSTKVGNGGLATYAQLSAEKTQRESADTSIKEGSIGSVVVEAVPAGSSQVNPVITASTATGAHKVLHFNFNEMVIDCGTF